MDEWVNLEKSESKKAWEKFTQRVQEYSLNQLRDAILCEEQEKKLHFLKATLRRRLKNAGLL